MKAIYVLPFLLALAACTFEHHTHIAWLDPAYTPASGDSIYSLQGQKPKTAVTVYRNGSVPGRAYHEILMLAVEGNGNQEPDAVQAFIDLSRRAGADAVLIQRPASGWKVRENLEAEKAAAGNNGSEKATEQIQSATISAEELAPNRRYLFQATAVVWQKK